MHISCQCMKPFCIGTGVWSRVPPQETGTRTRPLSQYFKLHIFYITPIVDFTHQCDNKIIAKEKMWLKGADIILIPEIPYNVDEVLNTIRKREKQSKKFTIIAMAEGAISDEAAGKTKMVNVDNELIRQAESLGISLGRKA